MSLQIALALILALGVACLFFPRRLQGFEARIRERVPRPTPEAVLRFSRSNAYVLSLRVVGAIGVLMVVVAEALVLVSPSTMRP